MKLAIDSFTIVIHQFESMWPISIHMTVTIWDTTIGKQERDLVCGFRSQTNEIPEHVRILQNDYRPLEYNQTWMFKSLLSNVFGDFFSEYEWN